MAQPASVPLPTQAAGVRSPVDAWGLLARHAAGIALVIALGALLVAPRWWMLATDPSEGVRIPITVSGGSDLSSDEALQFTTIRDAYDGELPVRSPHLANHADDALQAGAGWQEFIGLAGHLFGGPFESLAVVTTLMALAAFATLYLLTYHVTSSRLAAVAALPLAVLFAQVFFHLDGYATREQWRYLEPLLTLDPEREFLAWTRFLAPVLVLATFFALALALPRAAKTGDLRWGALASVSLALLIYSYVYYWTAAALAIAMWTAWLLYRRDLDGVRRTVAIGAVAVLLALPEIAIVLMKAGSATEDIQARVGQGDPGIILGEGTEIALRLIIGLPFLYALRKRAFDGGLYIAMFLAPLILTAIDGAMPQPWHYRSQVWTTFAIPAFVAGGGELYRLLGDERSQLARRVVGGLAALAFVYVVALQVRAIVIVDDTYAISADEYAAITWIEDNVNRGETVASPSIITTLLMDNLTPASGYIIGGYNPVADDDELIDRYLRIQRAYGYSADTTFDRLDPARGFPFDADVPESQLDRELEQHVAFYTFYWEVTTPERLDERMPAWRERFENLAREEDVLSAYPVEYLYCGPRERFWPAETPAAGTFVVPAFERETVIVYRVVSEGDPGAEVFKGCGS